MVYIIILHNIFIQYAFQLVFIPFLLLFLYVVLGIKTELCIRRKCSTTEICLQLNVHNGFWSHPHHLALSPFMPVFPFSKSAPFNFHALLYPHKPKFAVPVFLSKAHFVYYDDPFSFKWHHFDTCGWIQLQFCVCECVHTKIYNIFPLFIFVVECMLGCYK